MKVAGSVAGVCLVRNARDLAPFLCGHYLGAAGFAHLRFVDDGSSDGTREFLERLARRTARVSVDRVDDGTCRQPELVNAAINDLIGRGWRIVVPFDADEFWNLDGPAMEARYAERVETAFFGRWLNFVQRTEAVAPRGFGLLGVSHRAPPLEDADGESVPGYRRPFVCRQERKVAFKTARPVEVTRGQHGLLEGPEACEDEFELFHLPLRWRSEILKRGLDYEPRRAPHREHPAISWQSAFHRDAVLSGRVDEVWAANSANPDGRLHAYGDRLPLIRDARLRAMLIRAAAYMSLRFGVLAA